MLGIGEWWRENLHPSSPVAFLSVTVRFLRASPYLLNHYKNCSPSAEISYKNPRGPPYPVRPTPEGIAMSKREKAEKAQEQAEKRRGPSLPGGGKRKNRDRRREARYLAAEERQTERNARTDEQQIARLDRGGFTAVKERQRLRRRGDR